VTTPIPIAFYAPLKSPDHPAPSGDRTMARLLLKALRAAGFEPRLVSTLRSLDLYGDASVQADLRAAAEAEADRIASTVRSGRADAPRLWFTYHNHYKAPDWIGPRVAGALRIPYAVAEGSRAGKRALGPWALGHAGAEAALDRADLLLVMTDADREGLERALRPGQRLADLPPFTDVEPPPAERLSRAEDGPPRLLAVAMMRPGDKLASFRALAEALTRLADRPWTLDIVGDGEARGEVEGLFRPFGRRAVLRGRLDAAALGIFYAQADLFLWPAVNEAYGMVLLEAQAHGCPVVAGRNGGVSSVVLHGETGLLSSGGDAAAFTAAVLTLLKDGTLRRRLGAAARRFVREERGLAQAAERLRGALLPLVRA
jgi:glycosyltransferase involved in cell wall biosynthesis